MAHIPFFCFLLMTVLTVFTINVELFEFKGVLFTVTRDQTLTTSLYTSDVYSESVLMCIGICSLEETCCAASFSEETSICRLDISGNCCVVTHTAAGWKAIQKYFPPDCTDCVSFDMSLYKVIENRATWPDAMNMCKCLGGHLAEVETEAENVFIMNELFTRNTTGHGYWLGGFNFNNDSDLEWISKPNENMPYDFWFPNEPNNPSIENCLMAFKHRNFKWVDGYCYWKGAYICEFKYFSK